MRDRVRKALRTLAFSFDPLIPPAILFTIAQISPHKRLFERARLFLTESPAKSRGAFLILSLNLSHRSAMHSDVSDF